MEPEALAATIVAGQRFFFLLGAGVSLAAGIPTDRPGETGLAWLLAVSDTGDFVQAEVKFGTRDLHLPDLFPAINKTRFRLLIRQQNWMNRNPTVTHDGLARLVREGFAMRNPNTVFKIPDPKS
jgi:NAD-dependent SIR2 family protein deacetylase